MTVSVTHPVRIAGLDIVRFFAASIVLLFHFRTAFWAMPGVDRGPNLQENPFLLDGWVGVEIFFVLSGLVIAQSANGKSALAFFRGRLGRLMPAVWICGTVAALLVAAFDNSTGLIAAYLRTIVLYPHGPWVNGIYWTLTLEVTFYAAVFVLLAARRFEWIEQLAYVLGGTSAIYLFAVVFLGFRTLPQHLLLQHGCFFALGISFWLVQTKGLSVARMVLAAICIAAGLVEIGYIAHGVLSQTLFAIAGAIWLASLAAMCWSLLYPRSGNGVTETLGLMTYPLYLIHLPLGPIIIRNLSPILGHWTAFFVATVTAVFAAWVVVKIEPALRRLLLATFDKATDFLANYIPPRFRSTRKSTSTA